MSELIPIQDQNDGRQAVLGRDLHSFLGIGKDYSTWFNDMANYGFVAGQDFSPISGNIQGPGRPRQDHILTLDMAKELSMIQRTEKGKQARQYFIECEKRAKGENLTELDEAKLIQRAIQVSYQKIQRLEAENLAMIPKAAYVDTYVADEDLIQFRTVANQLNIGEQALRELLISKKWIYRMAGKRWSNKKNRIVTVNQYRAYADKKHLFRLVPCHDAPRIGGEVQQALKLTPMGAERVAAAVKQWGGTQTQLNPAD